MVQIEGLWWPDDVGEQWKHALMHVGSIEWIIAHCRQHRTAVQAGGNVGLWPRRLAQSFRRVITFEPEPISRECLIANVPSHVEVVAAALGSRAGLCEIARHKLGSHCIEEAGVTRTPPIKPNRTVALVGTVDALGLEDLDLLQLDIEGYEWLALTGAHATIARCRPLIQVELRNHTKHYGQSDDAVRELLVSHGYREVSRQQGSDFVFAPKERK